MLKTVLLRVVDELESCLVYGRDAKKFGDSIEALKEIIKLADMSKEDKKDDHHDEQGKDV